MAESGRLYKRAAAEDGAPGPLWHLGGGLTFFAGPLDYNASHQHGAPVYLAGLDGPFGLRIGGGPWLTCRTAAIPAGVRHELDLGGSPLAVFYVEATVAGFDILASLLRDAEEMGGALVGGSGETRLLRDLYEDRHATRWAGEALRDLLDFSGRRAARNIDPRLSRALQALQTSSEEPGDAPMPVAHIARAVGLSPSRFQHLFTEEMGVPFRRYRAWARMRAAIAEIVSGANFTTAAHTAGYADQAHFAHDFRRTFGAPASQSLTGIRS
jgi:AraC-like DNA-binding protein